MKEMASVLSEKDTSYYPYPDFVNPNIYYKMYWKDAENVISDMDQFSALYISHHGCVYVFFECFFVSMKTSKILIFLSHFLRFNADGVLLILEKPRVEVEMMIIGTWVDLKDFVRTLRIRYMVY